MEKYFIGAIVGSIIATIIYSFVKKPKGDFNNCKLENEQLKLKIAKFENDNESKKREIERLKRCIRAEQEKYDILKDSYDTALSENLKLNKTIIKMQSE